jgi:hypothetical protein
LPRLRRTSSAPALVAPDPLWVFVIGLGLDAGMHKCWPRYRQDAWKLTAVRHHFPLAAAVLDGLTEGAFTELAKPDVCRFGIGESTPDIAADGGRVWCAKGAGCRHVFSLSRFDAALVADHAALRAFRDREQRAAKTLAPYLDRFGRDLDRAMTAAVDRVSGRHWTIGNDEGTYAMGFRA